MFFEHNMIDLINVSSEATEIGSDGHTSCLGAHVFNGVAHYLYSKSRMNMKRSMDNPSQGH